MIDGVQERANQLKKEQKKQEVLAAKIKVQCVTSLLHNNDIIRVPYSGLILRDENFEVFVDFALSSKFNHKIFRHSTL